MKELNIEEIQAVSGGGLPLLILRGVAAGAGAIAGYQGTKALVEAVSDFFEK